MRAPFFLTLVAVGFLAASAVASAVNGAATLQTHLMPAENQRFGKAVAIDGDVAAIGAIEVTYVFTRTTGQWQEQVKLPTTSPSEYPLESRATVAVSGDTIALGQWIRLQRLEAPRHTTISGPRRRWLLGR